MAIKPKNGSDYQKTIFCYRSMLPNYWSTKTNYYCTAFLVTSCYPLPQNLVYNTKSTVVSYQALRYFWGYRCGIDRPQNSTDLSETVEKTGAVPGAPFDRGTPVRAVIFLFATSTAIICSVTPGRRSEIDSLGVTRRVAPGRGLSLCRSAVMLIARSSTGNLL